MKSEKERYENALAFYRRMMTMGDVLVTLKGAESPYADGMHVGGEHRMVALQYFAKGGISDIYDLWFISNYGWTKKIKSLDDLKQCRIAEQDERIKAGFYPPYA